MANVIQILIETSAKGGAQIAAAAQGVSNLALQIAGYTTVAGAAEQVVGELASAVKELTIGFIDQTEQLQVHASTINSTIPQYRALNRALVESGSSGQGAEQALISFNTAVQSGDEMVKALGITTKDTYTAFLQAVDILAHMEDKNLANAAATQLFGMRQRELIGRAGALAAVIPELTDHYIKHEAALAAGRASAERLDTAWDRLGRVAEELRDKVGGAFAQLGEVIIRSDYRWRFIYDKAVADGARATNAAQQQITADMKKIEDAIRRALQQGEKLKKTMVELKEQFPGDLHEGIRREYGPQPEEVAPPPDRFEAPGQGPDTLQQYVEKWKKAHQEIADIVEQLATDISSTMGAALQGLLTGTMNFGQAMRSIFQGLVQSIINMLVTILRNAVFKWLIRIAGNILMPGLGEAGSAAFGSVFAAGASAPRMAARPIVYQSIQTIDVKSYVQQTLDPSGVIAASRRRRMAAPA